MSKSIRTNSYAIIELLDLAGGKIETVLEGNLEAKIGSVQFNRRQLLAGIYFLKLSINQETSIVKLVIQ